MKSIAKSVQSLVSVAFSLFVFVAVARNVVVRAAPKTTTASTKLPSSPAYVAITLYVRFEDQDNVPNASASNFLNLLIRDVTAAISNFSAVPPNRVMRLKVFLEDHPDYDLSVAFDLLFDDARSSPKASDFENKSFTIVTSPAVVHRALTILLTLPPPTAISSRPSTDPEVTATSSSKVTSKSIRSGWSSPTSSTRAPPTSVAMTSTVTSAGARTTSYFLALLLAVIGVHF
ncbi:uncharacterized protein [Oscarella lobularis]|uniref:uncharacterized protein n=1 Tax=Oscarella lobularis TaxID=121494 RepID=UPI003314007B